MMTRNELEKLLVDLLELVTKQELAEIAAKLPADQQQIEPVLNALVKAGKITAFQSRTILKGRGKGLLLGTYLVLDKLGQGGFGTVFEARHRLMGRSVALKLMHPDRLNSQSMVDRFLREVRAAAKLEDPHIVKAYDADQAHGTYFLAMELVKGKVLSDMVKEKGPLPLATALDYVSQAAKGLEYAHRQGVIHRDIKPSNLILDAHGKVRVLDMGLARLDTVEENSREQLTKAGTSLGTSDFMAPEQAIDSIRADQRSDIYSLGCTLYALLCGEVMFPGPSETKRLLDHQTAPPPLLKHKRPDAPKQLDAIFQKMVAKLPENRYQTMVEVLAALDAVKPLIGNAASPAFVSKTVERSIRTKSVIRESEETGLSKLVTPSMIRTTRSDENIEALDVRQAPAWKQFLNRQPPQVLLSAAGAVLLCCVFVGWMLSGSKTAEATTVARTTTVTPIKPVEPITEVIPVKVVPQPTAVEVVKVEPVVVQPTVSASVASKPAPASEPKPASVSAPVVILHESFADATNGAHVIEEVGKTKTEGKPVHYLTSFQKAAEGETGLKAQMVEVTDPGFDGKPGCLRIQVDGYPSMLDFIGFKLGGRLPARHIALPTWTARNITQQDLEQTIIEFRYRAVRTVKAQSVPLRINLRLEQNHKANYATRLQFGELACTEEWKLFSSRMANAQNVEKFLEYAKENENGGFNLVLAPSGKDGFDAGDRFEFDDLKILSTSQRASSSALNVPANPASSDKTIASYSFSDAAGGSMTYNGEKTTSEGKMTHRVGVFGKVKPGSEGRLFVVAKEDASTRGPDGLPGVLSVQLVERPQQLQYTGFILVGTSSKDRIAISTWTPGQTTPADLAKTTLQFRHRLVRSPSAPKTPLAFGLRLEPDSTTDPHGKSIRLSSYESSEEWRTLTVSLGTAANQDVFLEHINSANTNRLQLTSDWPASNKSLQAGDTILIDDVKFLSQ